MSLLTRGLSLFTFAGCGDVVGGIALLSDRRVGDKAPTYQDITV
jgi:hypothetical protein